MVTRLGDAIAEISFLEMQKRVKHVETEDEWRARQEREHAEEERAKRRRRIEGFRCTDAMRDALVNATLSETDAVKRVRDWFANRDKPWLVLSGPTGCGKSMAAAVIPAERVTARFIRADELVRLFSSMFGDQYEQQQTLRDASLLVLDDLGCELDAQRMLPALLDLLDARQSARSNPTIVTTNLTPTAFRERYGNDRLNSRMVELVRWEGINSADLRRAK